MTLTPDPASPGLWRAAPHGTAGAHALIVGISEYPYLAGGSRHASVADDYGMGQLFVSAKTAARVFQWLNAAGNFAGQPLASCRLLLAPNGPVETAFVDEVTGGDYALPDFRALRDAVGDWSNEFLAAPAADAGRNVSFFFFSGHGLEHVASQSLLARDFLSPPGQSGIQHNIGFDPMRDALRTFNIKHSFYFIDSCRNDIQRLKESLSEGQRVLTRQANYVIRPASVMWLCATSSGAFSFQPIEADAPGTFFGQALIDGLNGVPPEYKPYDLAHDPGQLTFGALEDYASNKTRELVIARDPSLDQAVEPNGTPFVDTTVLATQPFKSLADPIGRDAPPPPPTPLPPHTPGGVPGDVHASIEARNLRFRTNLSPATNTIGRNLRDFSRSTEDMHRGFRHAWISDAWARTLQFRYLNAKSQTAPPNVARIRTTDAERLVSAVVDLVVPGAGHDASIWISVGGVDTGWPCLGVLAPCDAGPVPVRLILSFDTGLKQLVSLTSRIGPPDVLGDASAQYRNVWTGIWEAQKREIYAGFGRAISTIEALGHSEDALFMKSVSPVAAAIGASTLLRAGRLEALRDWPRNLANFYNSPEGAVLWAETLFRRAEYAGHEDLPEEAISYLSKLGELGPPRLAQVIEIAARRLASLRRQDPFAVQRVGGAAARSIDAVARLTKSGGVFATLGPVATTFDAMSLFQQKMTGENTPTHNANPKATTLTEEPPPKDTSTIKFFDEFSKYKRDGKPTDFEGEEWHKAASTGPDKDSDGEN